MIDHCNLKINTPQLLLCITAKSDLGQELLQQRHPLRLGIPAAVGDAVQIYPTGRAKNVDRGVKTGNDTLLVGGAGGEHPGMNVEERMAVMTTAHEAANGEVPVLTSIQHTDTKVIVELAQ